MKPADGKLAVVDLFCGGGGFSCGAAAAGAVVVYAADCDEDVLDYHRRNHPDAIHDATPLPHPIPYPAPPFHLHGSPPCQKFSNANTLNRSVDDRVEVEDLIDWFLNQVKTCECTTWSMEEVASKHVVKKLETFKETSKIDIKWAIFDLVRLGVPQTRKRLIAGTPFLIENLLRQTETQPRKSIKDVIANPRGTHIKDHNYSTRRTMRKNPKPGEAKFKYERAGAGDYCHTVNGPSPTILAGISMRWVTKSNGRTHSRQSLTSRESAALQTFPPSYKLPENNEKLALKIVGNSVPPRVAELLLTDACNLDSTSNLGLRAAPAARGQEPASPIAGDEPDSQKRQSACVERED